MVRKKISCIDCLNVNCIIKQYCPAEKLEEVSQNKMENRYAAHQLVFHEDNEVDSIYFLQKGIVKVFKNGAFNKDQIVRFSSNGDILGHRGFNSSGLYPVSAQTSTDALICNFSKEYFFQLLDEVPQLAVNLMLFYADELNYEETKLRDMALFSVREKVAKSLLILVDRFGLNEEYQINNAEILSRQDIAECVGLTSNQVTKVLGEFKQDQLIEIDAKKIKVLNKKLLEEIVAY